tara:strand:- start:152 stop:340 length:189 start_codon:yes stop_codon:yes gene_type:complete
MEELDKLPKQKYTKLSVTSIKEKKVDKESKVVEKEYIDKLLDEKFLSSYFDKISIKNKIDIK